MCLQNKLPPKAKVSNEKHFIWLSDWDGMAHIRPRRYFGLLKKLGFFWNRFFSFAKIKTQKNRKHLTKYNKNWKKYRKSSDTKGIKGILNTAHDSSQTLSSLATPANQICHYGVRLHIIQIRKIFLCSTCCVKSHSHFKSQTVQFCRNQNFPLLSQLARKYLSIQASSSPSERFFSKARLISLPSQELLKPGTVDMLTFLAENWWKTLNFKVV